MNGVMIYGKIDGGLINMKDENKFDKNSELIVSKILKIREDSQGRKIKEYGNFKADDNISLGSINNPLNEDIICFNWRDTTPPRPSKKKPSFGDWR